MQGGILSNAYASADVSSTGLYVGGVLGGNQGSLHDVYATGSVSGPNAAGLVGYNADAKLGRTHRQRFLWNTGSVRGIALGIADTAAAGSPPASLAFPCWNKSASSRMS